jgi:hypothetical protein
MPPTRRKAARNNQKRDRGNKGGDFILPLMFTERLCDAFDDEVNRIALEVGSRANAFTRGKTCSTSSHWIT